MTYFPGTSTKTQLCEATPKPWANAELAIYMDRRRCFGVLQLCSANVEPRYASIISGIPGHRIEDVKLSNIRIIYKGGGTLAHAAVTPPEKESNYPEPSMFGDIPAYGFFIRHADGVPLSNIEIGYAKEELRPAVVVHNVSGANFFSVDAQRSKGASLFQLQSVIDSNASHCKGVKDTKLERVERIKL